MCPHKAEVRTLKRRECAMKFYIFCFLFFFLSSILLGIVLPKVVGRKKDGTLVVSTRFDGAWCLIIVLVVTAAVLLAVVLYDMRQWDRFREPTMMAYGWVVAAFYAIWVLLRSALFLAMYFAVVVGISDRVESILNTLYQNGYLTFWRNRRGELVFGPTVIRNWLRRHRK